jgi:hypothetical protein
MSNYLDTLMTNNNVLSDSSYDEPVKYTNMKKKTITGGNIGSVATGSFPPIYKMSEEEKEKKELNKDKTFAQKKTSTAKSAASIADILNKRKNESETFISF